MTTSIDKLVFRFAGVFVLANLLQASFTGFCPLAMILKRLGAPAGAAFGATTR